MISGPAAKAATKVLFLCKSPSVFRRCLRVWFIPISFRSHVLTSVDVTTHYDGLLEAAAAAGPAGSSSAVQQRCKRS
jgi:hypothetical protein